MFYNTRLAAVLFFDGCYHRTNGKIPAVIGDTGFLLIPLQAIAPEPGFVPSVVKTESGCRQTKNNHR